MTGGATKWLHIKVNELAVASFFPSATSNPACHAQTKIFYVSFMKGWSLSSLGQRTDQQLVAFDAVGTNEHILMARSTISCSRSLTDEKKGICCSFVNSHDNCTDGYLRSRKS
jgi:hypothetical protein